MTKLSKSFVFYMKNFDAMQVLNGFDELDDDGIDALFEGSGLKDAQKMVSSVTDISSNYVFELIEKIEKRMCSQLTLKRKSKVPIIKRDWESEYWIGEKKPEGGDGFLLTLGIYGKSYCKNADLVFKVTSGFYHFKTQKDKFLRIEEVFPQSKLLREEYNMEEFNAGWVPIFDIDIESYEMDEEKIIEEFVQGLFKVLNQESLEKIMGVQSQYL